MLLGQLERMNGEAMMRDVETARQVTAKIFHLIQTQGESNSHSMRDLFKNVLLTAIDD